MRATNYFLNLVLMTLVLFGAAHAAAEISLPQSHEKGIRAFTDGHYKEAKAHFLSDLQDPASKHSALLYLGRIHLETGDPDGAEDYVKKALKIEPKQVQEVLLLGDIYCHKAQRSSMFSALKLARRCVSQYDAAVEMDGENIEALVSSMKFHLQAPSIAGGSSKEGKALLARLAELAPEYADTAKVHLYEKDGDRAAALQLAKSLSDKGFQSPQNHYDIAKYYRKIESYDRAADLFRSLSKRQKTPEDRWYITDSLLQLGEILIQREAESDITEGIALIEKYKEVNSNPHDVHYFWSTWSLAKGYRALGEKAQFEALVRSIKAENYHENSAFAEEFEASL